MNAKRNALAAPFGQAGVSLARQLLLWLLLPQLVLWMAGGVATYRFAAGYANEAIDASLSQASRALARQLKPIGSGLLIDFPKAAQDVLEADPADRRRKLLVVTPQGMQAMACIQADVARVQAQILSPLPQADQELFVNLLSRLVQGHEAA